MQRRPFVIDFHFLRERTYQFQVYYRHREEMLNRGIVCRFFPNSIVRRKSDADLFVVQNFDLLGDSAEKLSRPIIVEENADTSMPLFRDILALPNVVSCFKVSLVRQDWINLRSKRPHTWLLEGQEDWPKRRPLVDSEIAKLRPGIHFGLFNKMRPWVERARRRGAEDTWKKRPIDAVFIGSTEYKDPVITRHRHRFCRALRSISNLNIVCTSRRDMLIQHYFELSHQAKIIVSPWGNGEICYRDFEAILDDCVLIKPRTDFIRTLGDVLQEGESYVPCAIDASDLEHVIRLILCENKYNEAECRRRNRSALLRWWSGEYFVDWFNTQLMSILESA